MKLFTFCLLCTVAACSTYLPLTVLLAVTALVVLTYF